MTPPMGIGLFSSRDTLDLCSLHRWEATRHVGTLPTRHQWKKETHAAVAKQEDIASVVVLVSVDVHVHQIAEEDVILGQSIAAPISFVVVYDDVGIQRPSDGLDEVDVTPIIGGISVTVYDDISTVSRREVRRTVSWGRDSGRDKWSTCRSR